MTVEEIDWHDPVQLGAAHRLYQAILHESLPDDPHAPVEETADELACSPPWRHHRWWGIWDRDHRELLAGTWLELEYGQSNRGRANIEVDVRPDQRGRGLARDVLGPAVEVARRDGRTELYGYCAEGFSGEEFCLHIGATKGMSERQSRLSVREADHDVLTSWTKERSGYEMVGWDGPCPETFLPAFAALRSAENDAPRGGLGEEDEIFTVERVRQSEQTKSDAGADWWTLAILHPESGGLVGYTRLVFSRFRSDVAFQQWTAVHPDHRGHGLARGLKAAMVQRVLEERPAVERIDTDNATTNAAMLAINVAMGFRPLRTVGVWEIPTDRLAAFLEIR